jgi:hypothetical protein
MEAAVRTPLSSDPIMAWFRGFPEYNLSAVWRGVPPSSPDLLASNKQFQSSFVSADYCETVTMGLAVK